MSREAIIKAAVAVSLLAIPAAWPLANGLSGLTIAGGGGGPATGYATGGYSFPLGPYFCAGPEFGAGFGEGGAIFFGGGGRLYLNHATSAVAQPHLFVGGGLAIANDDAAAADGADTGGYVRAGGGCDIDIPQSPVGPSFDAGAFFFSEGEPKIGFIFGAGIRLNITRAIWMEQRRRERLAQDKLVGESLELARGANERGEFEVAINICDELLAKYPDRDDVRELLLESQRLLAESVPEPEPEPEPKPRPRPIPKPEPEPEPEVPKIPAEAVAAYERGKAAVSSGALGEAIYIFSAVVNECPAYGAARDALVDAYLLQGLDQYSRGRISDAIRSWRQALAHDPGNAKAQRYIDKAERERR